jgi:hypothetical protein
MLEKHAVVNVDSKSSILYECIGCGALVNEGEYDKVSALCKECLTKGARNGPCTCSKS